MIFKTSLTLASLLLAGSLLASNPGKSSNEDPSKPKKLFIFKTEKKFTGARVEIISESGEILTSQNLQKRKMIIDFGDAQIGTYTIKISKGDESQELQYIRK